MKTLEHTYLVTCHGQPHDSKPSQEEAEKRCEELRAESWGTMFQIHSGITTREEWDAQWTVVERPE